MGIKSLNNFLKNNSKKGIYSVSLAQLKNKVVVIDISIYLYKFLSEDALVENMYLLISTLQFYNIKMIFIYDGPSPPEKRKLLMQRREKKKQAEIQYNELNKELSKDMDDNSLKVLKTKINALKKEFIKITQSEIELSKNIISLFGEKYIVAPAEADTLCAYFVISKKADICISEDMDLFIYGCPFVLRYLSILKHTAIMYNYELILQDLNISHNEFQDICILSGTDYNNEHIDLSIILNEFKNYVKIKNENEFKNWFIENTDFCKKTTIEYYNYLKNLFSFDTNNIPKFNIHDSSDSYDSAKLKELLESNGFIFPNHHQIF